MKFCPSVKSFFSPYPIISHFANVDMSDMSTICGEDHGVSMMYSRSLALSTRVHLSIVSKKWQDFSVMPRESLRLERVNVTILIRVKAPGQTTHQISHIGYVSMSDMIVSGKLLKSSHLGSESCVTISVPSRSNISIFSDTGLIKSSMEKVYGKSFFCHIYRH